MSVTTTLIPEEHGVLLARKSKKAKLVPTDKLYKGNPYKVSYIRRLFSLSHKKYYASTRDYTTFSTLDELNVFLKTANKSDRVEKIVSISIPISKAHEEALINKNKKQRVQTIFRPKYFFDKYKYCWEMKSDISDRQRAQLNETYPELVVSVKNVFSETFLDDDMHVYLEVSGIHVKKVIIVELLEELA